MDGGTWVVLLNLPLDRIDLSVGGMKTDAGFEASDHDGLVVLISIEERWRRFVVEGCPELYVLAAEGAGVDE